MVTHLTQGRYMSEHTTRYETATAEVLLVEDEHRLADVFETHLSKTCAVQTVHTGQSALDTVHQGVDIVLLDRRLPDMSGRAVLAGIRDREIDCQVAMVSAVRPDEEILELDIDEYLRKPVACAKLSELVERLADRQCLRPELQTYIAKLSKKRALDAEQPVDSLASSSQYQNLLVELTERRAALSETLTQDNLCQTMENQRVSSEWARCPEREQDREELDRCSVTSCPDAFLP